MKANKLLEEIKTIKHAIFSITSSLTQHRLNSELPRVTLKQRKKRDSRKPEQEKHKKRTISSNSEAGLNLRGTSKKDRFGFRGYFIAGKKQMAGIKLAARGSD